jgi:hypothetical protein
MKNFVLPRQKTKQLTFCCWLNESQKTGRLVVADAVDDAGYLLPSWMIVSLS